MEQTLLVLPMALTVVGAFVLLMLSTVKTIGLRRYLAVAVAFLAVSFVIELPQFGNGPARYAFPDIFGKMYLIDDFSTLFDLMFLAGAILTLLINSVYLEKRKYYNGEFFALFLFSIFGMMTLAHANDLVTAFIGLELASLSIYALVGYHKNNPLSGEAMFKYLVLGSLAGAMFILGAAIIYGVTGTTVITEIGTFVQQQGSHYTLALTVAGMLLFVTILFKIGAVPFHAWVLDVYHGSPFPVTMFMASTFKIALFAVALRIYLAYFALSGLHGSEILTVLTILTLLGGSWLALSQSILKRMLAGSSIVHGGYMLIALSSIGLGSQLAAPAIMFYLLSYFISSVGAFGILSYIAADAKRPLTYDDFKGFAQKRPYLAAMMAIFMLSLSGFPSTIGFLGKFYIFTSAIESRQFLLAGLGIFIAFVSVYYYFKLIAVMYFYETESKREPFRFGMSTLLITMMALMAIWGGIGTGLIPFFPGADGLIDIAKQAIGSL
ncbi:NADH-quinone oxidoreductase subunit N [Hydrogenimonas urashimensis]|uniref:NADH-quinone oxidoreductase subunit N n=1 Tax=Hydrogenimonas urashimensis TaxID=2740515 RepID=UPI00191624F6|nr:NADH-quinone oxidoreductase subunit N [Hydrogenimonas urashimensis]